MPVARGHFCPRVECIKFAWTGISAYSFHIPMSAPSASKAQRPRRFLAPLAVGLVFWFFFTLAYRPVDQFIEDSFARLASASSGLISSNIVMVKLTDSMLTNRARVPFPREVLSKVIEEIAKTQPKAIVLDHVMERDRTIRDTALFSAMTNAGNVYLPQNSRFGPKRTVIPEPLIEPFGRGARGVAPLYFEDDGEQGVRSVALRYSDGLGRNYPTLPALIAGYTTADAAQLPERLPLRFRVPPDTLFPAINASALVQWSNTTAFSGLVPLVNSNTVVIIGPFYESARDRFAVPRPAASLDGTVAGAHLLAYALDTLEQRPWPGRMSRKVEVWLSVVALVVGYWFGTAEANRKRWIGPAAIIAYVVASLFAAKSGTVCPITLVVAGGLFGWCLRRLIPGTATAVTSSPSSRKRERSR